MAGGTKVTDWDRLQKHSSTYWFIIGILRMLTYVVWLVAVLLVGYLSYTNGFHAQYLWYLAGSTVFSVVVGMLGK